MAPPLVVVTGVMVWLLGEDGAQAALLEAITWGSSACAKRIP